MKKKPVKNAPVKLDLNSLIKTSVHEILVFPWKNKSNSVDEISCVHLMNKIPAKVRGDFMDECWRVLKPKGTMVVIAPYYSTMAAYIDFDYQWPPVTEMSFMFFNKEWRTNNKTHPELKCDFDFTYGYSGTPELSTRAQDVQSEWIKKNWNVVQHIQINLTKKV